MTRPSFHSSSLDRQGQNELKSNPLREKEKQNFSLAFASDNVTGIPGEGVQHATARTRSCSRACRLGESHLEAGQSEQPVKWETKRSNK